LYLKISPQICPQDWSGKINVDPQRKFDNPGELGSLRKKSTPRVEN